MQIVYVGPHEQVVVPLAYGEIVATRGEPVDVPDEVAKGEPARGEAGDPEFWPGSLGLLAQDGLWGRPQTKAAKAAKAERAKQIRAAGGSDPDPDPDPEVEDEPEVEDDTQEGQA